MMDIGGSESFVPSEGDGGMSEAASEAARQRFAGTAAALQQIQREEKKARKQDDSVAQAILQFLTDAQRTHLATLIARLVALNCPSLFILSVLSLINERCEEIVLEYLKEHEESPDGDVDDTAVIPGELGADVNRLLVAWIARMNAVLAVDRQNILSALLVGEKNIDGTILQLTAFVLQEFLHSNKKQAAFEKLQALSVGILHALFEPHLREFEKIAERIEEESKEEGDRNS